MSLKIRVRNDKKNSRGQCPVVIQYQHDSATVRFPTGVSVPPQFVDEGPKDGRSWIKKGHKGYTTANTKINQVWAEVDALIADLAKELGREPTAGEVRDKKNEPKQETKKTDKLIELYQEYATTFSGATRTAKYAALDKMKAYNPRVKVGKVNLGYVDGFVEFMRKELQLAETTIGKTIKDLKAGIHYFHDRGWIEPETFYAINPKKFKVTEYKPTHDQEKTFLTREEMAVVIQYDKPLPEHLQNALERNIVQLQTGLRVGDTQRIEPSMVLGGEIIMRSQKTDTTMRIPLTTKVQDILKRHSYTLPEQSDQKYNKALKTLYKTLGLDRAVQWPKYKFEKWPDDRKQEVQDWQKEQNHKSMAKDYILVPLFAVASSHMAVRSFITVAEELGMSLNDVCHVTGKTAKIIQKHYWGNNKESRMQGMSKFDQAFNQQVG